MRSSRREQDEISHYVELEAEGEPAQRLEKVRTEHLFGRKYDIWDVATDSTRYWVITELTNLYDQSDFPDLDQAFTFHLGLMERIHGRQQATHTDVERDRLLAPWRRFEQAVEAADSADEAEEFQAVGMRCRECLINLSRAIADHSMVPTGDTPPKDADFVGWSYLIAAHISTGRLRTYLRDIAAATWVLVNWLTHEANARPLDARIAVEATGNVLSHYSAALLRHERGMPDRCPHCGSYRIAATYRPEVGSSDPYVTVCDACGWEADRTASGA